MIGKFDRCQSKDYIWHWSQIASAGQGPSARVWYAWNWWHWTIRTPPVFRNFSFKISIVSIKVYISRSPHKNKSISFIVQEKEYQFKDLLGALYCSNWILFKVNADVYFDSLRGWYTPLISSNRNSNVDNDNVGHVLTFCLSTYLTALIFFTPTHCVFS